MHMNECLAQRSQWVPVVDLPKSHDSVITGVAEAGEVVEAEVLCGVQGWERVTMRCKVNSSISIQRNKTIIGECFASSDLLRPLEIYPTYNTVYALIPATI